VESPSELLAARIIEQLTAEKLVSQGDGKKLAAKLAAGKLRAEDWRLAIEKSMPEVESDERPA
jgi:hypothetical protein